MRSHRTALVLAMIILAALFVSAQIQVPTTHLEQDHGWAGPYPENLVNVEIPIPSGTLSPSQYKQFTVFPKTPGNGFVLRKVYWTLEFGSNGIHNGVYFSENGKVRFALSGAVPSTTALSAIEPDIDIVFKSGAPIIVHIRGGSGAVGHLTVIGYTF